MKDWEKDKGKNSYDKINIFLLQSPKLIEKKRKRTNSEESKVKGGPKYKGVGPAGKRALTSVLPSSLSLFSTVIVVALLSKSIGSLSVYFSHIPLTLSAIQACDFQRRKKREKEGFCVLVKSESEKLFRIGIGTGTGTGTGTGNALLFSFCSFLFFLCFFLSPSFPLSFPLFFKIKKMEKFLEDQYDMEDLNDVVDGNNLGAFKRRVEGDGLPIEIIGRTVS